MATSFSCYGAVSTLRTPIPLSRLSTFRSPSVSTIPNRFYKFRVKCSRAEAGVVDDSRSAPIDVVADVKSERVVVLGGSGFVGSAICKAAVSKGIEVISLSRIVVIENTIFSSIVFLLFSFIIFGLKSKTFITSQHGSNKFQSLDCNAGDVFYVNWDEVLTGATAVVSTIGGVGSEEQMLRINGEANVVAVNAAKEYGVPKFILISVHDYNLPSFLLSSAYFTGKRKAESEVLSKYPNSGVVLRPAFIYGKRKVGDFEIPLDLIGEPAERILRAIENFTKPLSSIPASDLLLAPPVSVDDLALAVLNAVVDDDFFGIFTIEQIKEAAAKVKV
ncbi:NAD(P)-bd dom domain-containing protein [Citrus sinensis]|uniref:NAD(P)-bd dom domain-containing protein n=1 Tax=Citrus sinensis TaxID=2711 RepID=A0ACB8KG46_CITSI|nr:NAD(P)-bd dom domain-containing protein [Citrus sinensis]